MIGTILGTGNRKTRTGRKDWDRPKFVEPYLGNTIVHTPALMLTYSRPYQLEFGVTAMPRKITVNDKVAILFEYAKERDMPTIHTLKKNNAMRMWGRKILLH